MRAIILSALACAALGAAAAETFDKGDSFAVGDFTLVAVEEPQLCIDRQGSNFRPLDDMTLLFVSEEGMFINRMSDSCPGLFEDGMQTSLQTNTRRLCRNASLFVFKNRGQGEDRQGCNLGEFTKVVATQPEEG
ncbi:MAG: hypothetical protein AAF253_00755 [Pseudomonadota bacterium]